MKNSDTEAASKMGVTIGAPVGEGFNRNQLLDTQDVADAVLYAVTAPKHVAVNEILIEPRDQE
jgi:NADP-dependent 3-hydroxy acid dehydrogenase YdfG